MPLEDYKVSVIVPVYNAEKYLKRCMDSLLAQTHKNIEILLVDDGSKDNTAGCTKQACGFEERYPQFLEKGAVIIGVSKDTAASHKKFREKYNLPFILLADTELETLQDYDVWKEKTMYGKKVMGVVLTTYIIIEEGIIEKAFGKVKAADNPQQMLDEL